MRIDTEGLHDFIDAGAIHSEIGKAKNPEKPLVREIIAKAHDLRGLSRFEAAVLLASTDPELDGDIFAAAGWAHRQIFGKRIVFFAPLYITNECMNQCAYCGFNTKNRDLKRRTLDYEEIRKEVEVLCGMGHKRLIVSFGEDPRLDAGWIAGALRVIYGTAAKKGGIRRVNVNIAPLDVDGFKKLAEVGIGTYQCFQETYHRPTYEKVHLSGRKADYLWRLWAMHRAHEAGIHDVAMGALFGLYDPAFEVMGLLTHAKKLEDDFGAGPRTVTFPRLEPALGAEMSYAPPYPTTDYDIRKIVAVLRLSLPRTGLILTTRERPELRAELMKIGVSQISAGSRTYPGAYHDSVSEANREEEQQFTLSDERPMDEIVQSVVSDLGLMPSWCTACYRCGRTGKEFVRLAGKKEIRSFCEANSLLTFKEYLEDFASEKTRIAGEALINTALSNSDNPQLKQEVLTRITRIEQGERDLFL